MKIILFSLLVFFQFNISISQVVPERDDRINIASFNVYKLGAVDSKYVKINEGKEHNNYIPDRVLNCADLLAKGNFGIIVLEEVFYGMAGDSAVQDLALALNRNHGKNYKWFTSEHIGKGLIAESMGFLYDDNVTNIKIEGKFSSLIPSKNKKNRKFVKTCWKAGDFDFTLIACHFSWIGNNPKRRQADYIKLNDILHNPLKYSDDPDVIVLGDFNRFGGGWSEEDFGIKKLDYNPLDYRVPHVEIFDKNIKEIQEVEHNREIKYPQNYSTTQSSNSMVYDMFFLTKDVFEEFPINNCEFNIDFGILVFDEWWGNCYDEKLKRLSDSQIKHLYSDHRPIWMSFSTNSGHSD